VPNQDHLQQFMFSSHAGLGISNLKISEKSNTVAGSIALRTPVGSPSVTLFHIHEMSHLKGIIYVLHKLNI